MIHPYIKVTLTFFVTLLLVYLFIPLAKKLNWLDKPTERKQHLVSTPHAGGLAIFFGFLFGMLLQSNYVNHFHILLVCGFVLILFGILDDLYSLSVRLRLVVQVGLIIFMMTHGNVVITSLGDLFGHGEILLGYWSWFFTAIAIIGFVNAFNMMDGLDGLAGGLAFIIIGFFLYFSQNKSNVAGVLILLMACLLAFLCFNARIAGRRRAAIFLGDAGSTFLGFSLAWFAIKLSQGPGALMSPVTVLWVLAVPVFDFFNVFISRLMRGKSPFLADRSHFHHLLLERGVSSQAVTLTMIFISFLFGAMGCWIEKSGVLASVSLFWLVITFIFQFIVVSIIRFGFFIRRK